MVEISKLEALAHLRNSGALTENEYQQEKDRLLRRAPTGYLVALGVGVLVGGIAVGAAVYFKLQSAARPVASPAANTTIAVAANSPSLASQVAGGKLALVFKSEMLDARIPYLESLVGPAMSVSGDQRTYKVDGCNVEVGVAGAQIISLGLKPTAKCDFNLDEFLPNARIGSRASSRSGSLVSPK